MPCVSEQADLCINVRIFIMQMITMAFTGMIRT